MAETPFSLQSPNGELWNLDIDANGRLAFNANDAAGGVTRMFIEDDSGRVVVEGNVEAASLYATDESGSISIRLEGNTGEIKASSVEAKGVEVENANGLTTTTIEGTGSIFLGAGPSPFFPGQDGDLFVRDATGSTSIRLSGSTGNIEATRVQLGNAAGLTTVEIHGGDGNIEAKQVQLGNAAGLTTIYMQGSGGYMFLGADPSDATPGEDGDLFVRDGNGGIGVRLAGSTGYIEATSVQLVEAPSGQPRIEIEGSSGSIEAKDPFGLTTVEIHGGMAIYFSGLVPRAPVQARMATCSCVIQRAVPALGCQGVLATLKP